VEWKVELLEWSGVPKKGLVESGQSMQTLRSLTEVWIRMLHLLTVPG